ncbi:DUF835 domain-containing protein [Thermococcus piezophilus]|uniref:DUF835 domain-containing protein n=1 Tax=Thermococcus piezophilus TaxID=1712654 RepID=A0A172WHF5_9EURY|nr:DUF835 domain-containing protein [Thermococcus piezophilus]ANF22746.1 hypothetical protein A7C91_05830 [Thermococcus piezophilus]
MLSEEFIKLKNPVKANIEPGVKLIPSDEYRKMKEMFREYPALAFVRDVSPPETCRTYFITNTRGENAIHPTNLAKMLELSNRYLREAEMHGLTGVIILDGIEYLTIYNGITAVVKFLAILRDMVVVRNGSLLVVVDEAAWEKKYRTIRRILLGE